MKRIPKDLNEIYNSNKSHLSPKTEIQQLKDILAEKITLDIAENYNYVSIDHDCEIYIGNETPTEYPNRQNKYCWVYPRKDAQLENIVFIDSHLIDFIDNNAELLCFEIKDLKGVN